MKIISLTIPHKKQRYNTCGDWYEKKGWQIRVSKMKDWRYNVLVAFHELIEMTLCKYRHVSEKKVTDFDIKFEGDDPGRDKNAPYHNEHMFAEKLEKQLAKELGVDWDKYDKTVCEL